MWKGHFPSYPHLVSVFAQEVFLSVICSDRCVQMENNRGWVGGGFMWRHNTQATNGYFHFARLCLDLCMFVFFNAGYQCESMNVCVAVGGVGANHVLITGPHPRKREAVCPTAAAAGSSTSPSASVTVIKTSRCTAVSLH